MSYVTLEKMKAHLSMIHSADDDLIQDCIDAAESYCAAYMDRPGIYDDQVWEVPDSEDVSSSSSEAQTVPSIIVQVIKAYAAEMYERRSIAVVGTTYTKVPMYEDALHLYRTGLGV